MESTALLGSALMAIGRKAIVTCDNYFFGADGQQYRAAFGTVVAVLTAEATLGIRPNGRSTNWYLQIGRLTIAGCQLHYLVQSDTCNLGPATDWIHSPEHGAVKFERPCIILDADTP